MEPASVGLVSPKAPTFLTNPIFRPDLRRPLDRQQPMGSPQHMQGLDHWPGPFWLPIHVHTFLDIVAIL
jgi:hypothetical protein